MENQFARKYIVWFLFFGCLLLGAIRPAFPQEKKPFILAPLSFEQSTIKLLFLLTVIK
ncbi:MAG: hypothetical protein WA705_31760 [Candidatus Ozemobacteraceae bacterium]